MDRVIHPDRLSGRIAAIPSKSDAHRLLFCAALAYTPTEIAVGKEELSADIHATINCIRALGGDVTVNEDRLLVTPIPMPMKHVPIVCDCGESGSTARFLLPIAAVLSRPERPITLVGHGRLPERPFAPLCDVLRAGGTDIDRDFLPITVRGPFCAGDYRIAGDISSQYITGLLLALPLCEACSSLTLTSPLQSRGYVDMTLYTLSRFGINIEADENSYTIPALPYRSPGSLAADGDWSNAAFWLCAGAISAPITVIGLSQDSRQGDRQIADILRRFGASVKIDSDSVTVSPGALHGITLSVADIPDLVPVLAVVAALAEGESRFTDAGRLRLKESDRLATVTAMLTALGGEARIDGDTLLVRGRACFDGGTADSANDHRIAMAAAIAALRCRGSVTLRGAEAVAKSYPAFWQDYKNLSANSF